MKMMPRMLVDTLTRYRRYRRRVSTERALNRLPPSVLRDIGWPDPDRIEER